MNLREMNKIVNLIEKSKEKIGKERDILRGLYEDLDALIEDLGDGIDIIEDGLIDIRNGLDIISKKL